MSEETKLDSLLLRAGPQIKSRDEIPGIMYTVVAALLPVSLWSCWVFGRRAVYVIGLSVVFTLAFEYFFLRLRMNHRSASLKLLDGSAFISGLLLALNLGPGSPWWLILVGAGVAMGIGKHVFGGIGCNPFNPVLVARVFLLLSFPLEMTTWFAPDALTKAANPLLKLDGITSATPLGVLKESGWSGLDALFGSGHLWHYVLFNKGGCLGDVSILALLIGVVIMLAGRVISLRIPLSYIGTLALVTSVFWVIDPVTYANPLFHIVSGSLILGAFYMATDMVTSPISDRGHLVFGMGCGLITAVIRLWGGYPEGVSFAILIMNGLVPLIDKATKPKVVGLGQSERGKE